MIRKLLVCLLGTWAASSIDAAGVSLSGTVLNEDSTARPGVVVALSGTNLTAMTGADGKWSLSDGSSSLVPSHASAHKPLSKHVSLDGGRLRLALDDRDAQGRSLSGLTSVPSRSLATRAASSASLDTLIYSWNGKAILRDTIAPDCLPQTGILRFFDTTVNAAITYGYVGDSQGHLYRTVAIGTQVWMAQNYRYEVDSSWCYSGSVDSCDKYGRLYQWASLMGLDDTCNAKVCSTQVAVRRGLCPKGWHVPSDDEWFKLTDTTLVASSSGRVLKSKSGWSTITGTDSLGFHALPGGMRLEAGGYSSAGAYLYMWSATERNATTAQGRYSSSGQDAISRGYAGKASSLALRCLEDY